ITYRLTTDAGEFKVPGLPFDVPLRLMATYSGYEAYRKDFVVTAAQPTVNFGTIKLTGTSKQLDEVIVYAERPPVVIKKDTIEFNASAFKTLPTALLEDLLKKLPGIQVDENGDITVNGQKVNRILVDGKRFFGDDPKMATKNLPSNMVDKVQVMDDKDEIAQNNDGDMSKIGKVINLTLKKNIKKALFGKLYVGGGTAERYEAGGIINTFRDTLQMSMMAYRNNINRTGFAINDIISLGGFNRASQITSMSVMNGAISLNNISFGGGSNGIVTSTGAGLNVNHSPTKNLNIYGQYFYGATNNVDVNQLNTQRFFGDTILSGQTNANSNAATNTHTVNAGGNWRDSLTVINFSGGFVHAMNQINAFSAGTIQNSKFGPASNSSGNSNTNGTSDAYSYNVSLTHRFAGKKARNISFNHNLSYTRNPVDNINENINNFLYPSVSTFVVQQLRATNSPNTSASIGMNYSDALSPKLTLRINERIEYSNQAQLVGIYAKHAATGFYDSLNVAVSNDLRREQTRWNNQLSFGYRINKVQLNLGASLYEQWISNQYKKGGSSQLHYSNLLFNTGLNWNRINVNLSTNASAPSINYLNPVTDNSNPFYIVNGNPNLRQSRQTSLNVNGNIFNVKNNVSYGFNFNASAEKDAVIQALVINSSGVQVSTPINVDDVRGMNTRIGVNKQFKKNPKFIFSADLSLSGNMRSNPLMFNNILSRTSFYNVAPAVRFTFNWHDVVEFNPSASVSFRKVTYTSPLFTSTDYTTQNLQGEFIVRVPKKFVWETNVAYRYNSNLAPGLPKTNIYWNAALTFLMFKEDKGQLKLAVNDILNSNSNAFRFVNGNLISDSRSNVLQRYFMLTYSYNIRSLAGQKAKVGGNQQGGMFRF
ncbi:MAG: hypothetical protein JWQ30_1486, partial [Sediminibacterium sp.]|nr:hypothetical protein [Sediminibacterium sp.]